MPNAAILAVTETILRTFFIVTSFGLLL